MRRLLLAVLGLPAGAGAAEVVDVELDGGFSRAVVDVGGFVQPRFDVSPSDAAAGTDGTVGFAVQRARFEVGGRLEGTPAAPLDVSHKFSVELMPEARLNDAYVDLGPHGVPVAVRLGQFKSPVSRALLTSDKNSMFPHLTMLVDWIPTREMGAMVHTAIGENHVEAQAAVFNGEGTNRLSNVNRKFLYAGRLVISPLGGPGTGNELYSRDVPGTFSIGGSVHRNEIGNAGLQEGTFGVAGEAFAHWGWFTAQGEVLWRWIDFEDTAISDYVQRGWYAQLGVFPPAVPWVQDHVALMGRVEQGDSLYAEGVLPAGPLDDTQANRRIGMGLGLYAGDPWFDNVQQLRLVVAYTVKTELEGFPVDDDTLTALVSYAF